MPSSRSPSVRSFNSAKSFRTFNKRFSMRTPVCTRSTSIIGPPGTMVYRYHGNTIMVTQWQSILLFHGCPTPSRLVAAKWLGNEFQKAAITRAKWPFSRVTQGVAEIPQTCDEWSRYDYNTRSTHVEIQGLDTAGRQYAAGVDSLQVPRQPPHTLCQVGVSQSYGKHQGPHGPVHFAKGLRRGKNSPGLHHCGSHQRQHRDFLCRQRPHARPPG